VYKLSSINGNPTLKISENIEKITLPDTKKIVRYLNEDGSFYCDGVLLEDEGEQDIVYHPHVTHKSSRVAKLKSETLLSKMVDQGRITITPPKPKQSATYALERLAKLNQEHKRFDNPHVYKVGVSKKLRDLKDQLVQKG
jgi:nicotinate phosphoribosyltransferase